MLRINFTQATLDGITPPAKGQAVVYDSKVQWLCAWISPVGRITFYSYQWSSDHGKPIRRKLGVFRKRAGDAVGMSIAQARDLAKQDAADVAGGKDTAADKAAERQARKIGETVGQVFESFMAEPSARTRRPRSASTVRDYRGRYDLHLSKLANKRLAEIKPEQVQKLHRELTDSAGPYTANRVAAIFAAMCDFAKRKGIIERNPAEGIEKNAETPRERYITEGEAGRFWSALQAEYAKAASAQRYGGNPDHHRIAVLDAITFALFTGQRRGNIESLRWDSVDLKNKTMTITREQFKGKRPHVANLPAEAVEILQRRKGNGSEFVFNSNASASGHITEPKTAMADIIKAAGIDHVRFHDLRHTFAAWQVTAGTDLYLIGKQLGHRSMTTTQRYAHLDVTKHADKIAAGASAFAKAGEKKDDPAT